MKLNCGILIFSVLAFSISACSKKDNVAGTATPNPNVATTQSAAAVTQTTLATYPYTDTFAGTMVVSFNCLSANYDSSNNKCKFYIIHISPALCRVYCAQGVQLQLYGGVINIDDSLNMSGNPVDLGNFNFPYTDHPYFGKNTIAFSISANALSVSWDIPYLPLIGACDWGESKAQYSGTLIKRQRRG